MKPFYTYTHTHNTHSLIKLRVGTQGPLAIAFLMVTQKLVHKTLLKLMAFVDSSFPNNELRNTP